ncbi:MAG: hypothetical protein IJL26_07930, partial [Clostridia bacterium]|nr:hypothetical protein [Clostridia bacterium]
MSKKKWICLIAAVVCFMYALSLLGAFFLCTELDRRQFEKAMQLISQQHQDLMDITKGITASALRSLFDTHFAPVVTEAFSAASYPLMYVLTDGEGNIVSRSGVILETDIETSDGQSVHAVLCLDPYINAEAQRQIQRFTHNADEDKMYLDITRLSVCEKDGAFIPVEMTLLLRNKNGIEAPTDGEKELTVRLNDGTQTYTASIEQGQSFFFYSWYLMKDPSYRRRWNRLYDELQKNVSACSADSESLRSIADGFDKSTRDVLKCADSIRTRDGENYTILLLSRRGGLSSVLQGDFFLASALYLTFAALLFAAAAEVAAVKLYDKN